MQRFISIAQIIVAILLVGAILIQNKGAGIGGVIGGDGGAVYRTKRGAEKFLFYGTIVLGVLLAALSLAHLLL